MASLSNLVDNLAEEIHKIKCKFGHDNKKSETCGIKYKDIKCCLEYTNVKDDWILYKCLCYNRNYQKTFDDKRNDLLIHITKFILLLQKSVYPYEYMDDWEKFNETSLAEKKDF